jgi:hypothetical protein
MTDNEIDRWDVISFRTDKRGITRRYHLGVAFAPPNEDFINVKFEALPLPDIRGEVWVRLFPEGTYKGSSFDKTDNR